MDVEGYLEGTFDGVVVEGESDGNADGIEVDGQCVGDVDGGEEGRAVGIFEGHSKLGESEGKREG